ncbi:alpha-amylase family glycosyl hydrolase [Paenibacillus sp. SI8]|uniref:alpha-amylase family glycosyl hydrolase n=1 Tax=unclassified Paenibacillus TaxID=185978 RepID=UPI0034662D07
MIRISQRIALLLFACMLSVGLSGCERNEQGEIAPAIPKASVAENVDLPLKIDEQPSSVYYQIFIRSFNDSNGDSIGDLKGITQKLSYLKELGIEGIWLTPLNPSPSYHGFDVTDYYNVNPQFGTLDDFRELMKEAHKQGIKVVMDLVLNHTSSKHPWFVDAMKGKDSPYRDWYVWTDETDPVKLSETSATGGAAWHKKDNATYLGVFWEGMPDLNFDNPQVRKEMIKVGNFWLKQGVDGFRLDAAKHVYEDFQSSKGSKEVVEKNQAWWQEFRKGIQETNPKAYLIGEVWDTASVVAPFLDHAFDSTFNFDLNKVLLSSADTEKSSNLANSLMRNYQLFAKASDSAFIDAPFLGNHDLDRVMSALNGNVDHAKMAASLLLTVPGNPFIYYGDEIGMKGRGQDENKREPMLWYKSGKGEGQTNWEPALSNGGSSQPSVEAQLQDPESIYSHYKKLIDLRKREPALRDGDIRSFEVSNPSISAFVRMTVKEKVLVVHNLSGKEQMVEMKMSQSDHFQTVAFSTKERVKLEDGKLTIPPYSTVILK